jgi:hypothetical protein
VHSVHESAFLFNQYAIKMYYEAKNDEVFGNKNQQQIFIQELQNFILTQQYQGLFVLCGDFLL